MKSRRFGCVISGLVWVAIFGFTNFGLALGDPVDRNATNPLAIAFWVEIAVLIVGAFLFYRAQMKDGEF